LKAPILLYHRLFNEKPDNHKYSIHKNEFEKQIKYLSDNGFQSILIKDLNKAHTYISSDKKPIAITFDDGNYSDYTIALPILRKFGFVATFFVTVNWIGKKNFLQWSHLKKICEVNMSVQSHSLTHPILSDLQSIKLYKEVSESKKIIENRINSIVNFFSIPGGFFSKELLSILKQVNYKGMCTSVPGLNAVNNKKKEFIIFKRLVISRSTSFENYKAIVNGNPYKIALCKIQHFSKYAVIKLIGTKNYYNIWSRLFRDI
jgi:peptidoglycan/xylan/chitin deacetylase (PgdA/CDA1 family)